MVRISNPPQADSLMMGARSIGNYNLAAALGDLIDNSITAGANTVSITCNFNAGGPFIIIKDNGIGMDRDTLVQAMRPASANPQAERHAKDLGRFGWGLKSASFSQATRLIVGSKQHNQINVGIWDLDNVINFEMELLENEDARLILEEFGEKMTSNGTIIIWDKCDRLTGTADISQDSFNQKVIEAKKQLELIFHQFLHSKNVDRLTLYLNGSELKGYDPFLSEHPATQCFHSENIEISNHGSIQVTPYVLPHYSKLDQQTIQHIEGSEGLIRNQGFYVYRNNRLIIHGTWFGIFKYGELSDLVRVKIEIPNNMDHIWQISIDKQDAKLPQHLKFRLKKLLAGIHVKSKRVYNRRSKQITLGGSSSIWAKVKKSGKTKFELNRDNVFFKSVNNALPNSEKHHLDYLLKYIENTLPITNIISTEANEDNNLIQNETNNTDTRDLGKHLAQLLFKEFRGDEKAFREMVSSSSYFINQQKLAHEITDEILMENSK